MRTYEIPRDYKGEGRILYIFSTKGLIFTCAGAGIGLIFYFYSKNVRICNRGNYYHINICSNRFCNMEHLKCRKQMA